MAWRKPATMAAGAVGAAMLLGAQRSVTIKPFDESGQEEKGKDWRKTSNRFQIMTTKVGSILRGFVTPDEPPPAWERKIASMPGLVQNFDVSHMAQSSTDGLLFVGLPRVSTSAIPSSVQHELIEKLQVYQPKSTFTEKEQEVEEEGQRLAKTATVIAVDSKGENSTTTTQQTEEAPEQLFLGQPRGLPGRDTYCVWHFGKDAVGHPETVHGGAIAMAIDESCGHAFMSLGRGPGYTAFLHVNYRKPMPAGHPTLVKVVVEKIVRRKVYLHAVVTDGSETKFADAECLFVIPRPASAPVDPPGFMSA